MSLKSKKIISMITAVSMIASICSMNVFAADEEEYTQFPFTTECETLEGAELWTSIYENQIPGYSGDGFAYLTNGNISFEVTVPEDGMYEITARYAQILDENGREQTISINGAKFMYKFPYANEWSEYSFGVHRLNKGVNTIELLPQYGYAAFDTITVDVAQLPDLSEVQPVLSDKKATKEAQGLMNYLCDVYGKNIISGQQEIYGGGNDGNPELEFEWIEELTGELPAIRGFDFMNYNPLYGWDDGTTERIIEWTNERNGIATACWHINVPVNFENYTLGDAVDWTECTYKPTPEFDAAKASVEGTKEYEYFMAAVEDLAEQLTILQENNVPIIFRPLHEAEGNGGLNGEGAWFWWSSAGAEAYNNLWKLLYTTLTETYGLHNIIWEQNLYTWSPESAQWYTGDDYVDMVGYDKYNTVYNRNDGLSNCPNEDAISTVFYGLVDIVDNKKLVAMPENDTIPNIENMQVEKAGWLYFCPWYGEHLMSEAFNYQDSLVKIYQSDYTITLDELPDWRTYSSGDVIEPPVTETTTTTETTEDTTVSSEEVSDTGDITTSEETESSKSEETTTTTESSEDTSGSTTVNASATLLGDANCDGIVDIRDVTTINQYIIKAVDLTEEGLANSDVISDGVVDVSDLGQIKKFIIKLIDKL